MEHDEPQRTHQDLQADVWEDEAEVLLDRIGVEPGWTCADLACGATGILVSLARRVGGEGRIIGIDRGAELARRARVSAHQSRQLQVHLVLGDLLEPPLLESSFDLVHVRFALHLVEPAAAIARMKCLARPGGWVAVQEPDLASWRYDPEPAAWPRLLAALQRAIAVAGDPNVGREVPGLLRGAGLEDVEVRAVALTLTGSHPHMRLPLAWAAAQRDVILERGLASAAELDEWLAALERHLEKPSVRMLTPTTIQAWGRRAPAHRAPLRSGA